MKTAFLLNDTTREIGHIGCELTIRNIVSACLASGIEIASRDQEINDGFNRGAFTDSVESCDIVLVNGEGTLHHNAGSGILKKCRLARSLGKPIFLINAVWQANERSKQDLDLFDLVFVREPASHREISKDGRPDARIVPDMVFYSTPAINGQQSKAGGLAVDSVILEVTREISAFARARHLPMYFMGEWHRRNFARHHPLRFLLARTKGGTTLSPESISSKEYVVTGRYHGACLSIASATPFIAISSNTHKIEGLVEALGLSPKDFIVDNSGLTRQAIDGALSQLLARLDRSEYASRCSAFLADARKSTLQMFHDIYQY